MFIFHQPCSWVYFIFIFCCRCILWNNSVAEIQKFQITSVPVAVVESSPRILSNYMQNSSRWIELRHFLSQFNCLSEIIWEAARVRAVESRSWVSGQSSTHQRRFVSISDFNWIKILRKAYFARVRVPGDYAKCVSWGFC